MTVSLTYRVKDLKSQEEGIALHVSLSKEFLARELAHVGVDITRSSAEVTGHIRYLLDEQVEFQGVLSVCFGLTCDRCLEQAVVKEQSRLHILFVPNQNEGRALVEESDAELDMDEPDVLYHNGDVIDLAPMLREQMLLLLPITVFCKEDCLGLCAVCGENRNVVACQCRKDGRFSPFEKLKGLL